MRKSIKLAGLIWALLMAVFVSGQDAVTYQTPPKEIADLLLAKPAPLVSMNSKASWLLVSERNSYPTVEELGQPESRIAGLRINPNNYAPSRQNFINNFILKNLQEGKEFTVTGLPVNLLAGNVSWSPSETKIAFTHTTSGRVDLYVIDVNAHRATRINQQPLNTIVGTAYVWVDDHTLIYKTATRASSMAPKKPITPKGPTVQQSLGKTAPSPTYQDLIKSPYDEQLFEFFATAQLVKNKDGVESPLGKKSLVSTFSLSPDKKYLLIKTLKNPFSYLVTALGFPSTISIQDLSGKLVKVLAELPSSEGTPSGYDNTQNVPRAFDWRDDEAATVTWAFPLDSGLIKKKVPFHDAVYALAAPFTGEAKELFKTTMRYAGTTWGNSSLAMVTEISRSKQQLRVSRFRASSPELEPLYERATTDAYGNPGSPVTTRNTFGRQVILMTDKGTKILMNNPVGSSPNGDLPFLAKFDLNTKQNEIIWRCQQGYFEFVSDVIDPNQIILLTRRESQKEVPNYYIKKLIQQVAGRQVTQFTNPYPELEGVTKEKIKYQRADGVSLTGDLYLPKNYQKEKDGPLPTLIWAYPREFNSAADAAQVRGSKDHFTTLIWASPIFYVTQGYAILDNAEMPIVSEGPDKKPNDNFVAQLQMNAEAAIQKLVSMGVGDKNRMAVGGHSYGAFMTANLLAHTQLFKAGIARSGAYNRTLTPFGFQNEDRTYWQVPKLYYEMSPFSYADKIKTPLLLIHGEADDNTGTYPINSERLFAAIKGNGGTVRFVFLPYEAHSYRGKENLLHMLWEQNEWLDKYVKNAKP